MRSLLGYGVKWKREDSLGKGNKTEKGLEVKEFGYRSCVLILGSGE